MSAIEIQWFFPTESAIPTASAIREVRVWEFGFGKMFKGRYLYLMQESLPLQWVPYVTEGLNKHDIEPMFTTVCTFLSLQTLQTLDRVFQIYFFLPNSNTASQYLQESSWLALGKCYAWVIYVKDIICWNTLGTNSWKVKQVLLYFKQNFKHCNLYQDERRRP